MKSLYEKTIKSERIYSGKILNLDVDSVTLPNGEVAIREIVRHPGAVAILPIDHEGNIYLVRQFRKAIDREILEIPAGKLEANEDALECAKRELAEEIGKKAISWNFLFEAWPAPGFSDEKLFFYVARDLSDTYAKPDDDEFIHVEKYNAAEVAEKIRTGEIQDTKTIAAFLGARWLIDSKKE